MKMRPQTQRPINEYINDLFMMFMHDHGIEDGDLPSHIDREIEEAAEALREVLVRAHYWCASHPKNHEFVCSFMTRDGMVEILRWGRDDYSAEFHDADYSVRGSFEDVIREIEF